MRPDYEWEKWLRNDVIPDPPTTTHVSASTMLSQNKLLRGPKPGSGRYQPLKALQRHVGMR
jgi:hypothetical protein